MYCFNASTFKFFVLKKEYKNLLESLLSSPDDKLMDLPNFKNLLLEGRFLLDDSENELDYIYKRNQSQVDRLDYKLVILPTFSCNFKCWYCIQCHKREFMAEQVVELVKKHILYMIQEKKIRSLNIEWFGGEPLLGFENVIYPITSYAKECSDQNNIPFSSSATTNGYLFTKEMLIKMRGLDVVGFQITLDGMREFHDKVRVAPNKSSFDEILKRINLICDILEDANVKIRINYDDKKVLDSLGTGRSDGVFQLESAGMKNFMKELKPQSLEDVIAGISLYRPGPMDFIPQYIRGKNRPDTIRYDCPQLEPILKPTYGCIVYQEQVMQIVRNLAGYTLGRSDLVRRAMSKKKASVMEKERQNFVYGNEAEGVPGCIANGIDEATANKIYDEMIDFAKYAFNKSHAAAYAVVSYQTAYLKYYYPVEFMAALMTSVIDFPNKVAEYILVCRQMGIKILPPDVNCGMYGFSVDNGAIRYGLSAIKSVGRPVIESLVREREENGQYRSLKDFMERNSPQMNKRAVENFIKAGALDCLDGNRRQKMLVYQKISDSISQDKKNSLAGQMSLFDLVSEEDKKEFEIRMPDVEEFGKEELLGYEKEVLGIYLSGHPLENYRGMMEKTISAKTSDFQQDEETNLPKVTDGQKVIIGGMITDKTIKYTKNNKVMAFLTVEDLVGTVEVVVFPRDYEKSQQFLNEEGRVFIQGRVSAEDDRASKLILEKIRPFDNMPREIWIQFDNKESYTQQSQELLADLRRSPGDSAVVIYLKDVKAIKKLPVGYHAQIQDSWLNYMYEKYGKTNVKVVERGLKNL